MAALYERCVQNIVQSETTAQAFRLNVDAAAVYFHIICDCCVLYCVFVYFDAFCDRLFVFGYKRRKIRGAHGRVKVHGMFVSVHVVQRVNMQCT